MIKTQARNNDQKKTYRQARQFMCSTEGSNRVEGRGNHVLLGKANYLIIINSLLLVKILIKSFDKSKVLSP